MITIPTRTGAGRRRRRRRAAVAGKPVRFDRGWLTPFFESGHAKEAVEEFRDEDWDKAETEFAKAIKKLPRDGGERHAAKYMLALARANQGKWNDAGELFEELFKSYPKLAPYHAYNAARCRLRRGDAAGALEWAARVADGSVPKAEAELVRIDALRTLGRWSDALAALEGYLQQWPNGPRRAESLFKKAEAMEKAAGGGGGVDARKAAPDVTAIYRRVWAEAPTDGWGDRAAERLEQIAAALPSAEAAAVRARTAGELMSRGMVLFDRNRNQESEAAFAAALAAPGLDADLECRARFHRAQSLWKQRQRQRAAPLFDEAEVACGRAKNQDLHAKALYQGARSYSMSGNKEAALARFARVEAEHADHSYADDARIRSAEIATDAGDDATAAKLLAEVPTRYPKADLLNEALWRLAFAAWRAGRDDEALRWLDENLRLVPREEIWYAEGRVQYWKGRVFEKRGKRDEARGWYERAVREYPLSVYALLSLNRLKTLDPAAQKALIGALRKGLHEVPAWSFPPRALYDDAGFLRAVELARMGQGVDARRELNKVGLVTSAEKRSTAAARAEDEDLIWITSTLLDRGGVWNASHSLPRHALTSYKLRIPEGDRRGEVEARLPARVPGAGRQEHQGQRPSRSAAARDHARGERFLAAHRIGGERHRVDPDADQDRQAFRERRQRDARSAAGPGQEPRDRLALSRLPVEALRRGGAAGDRRLQRGRGGGRSLAGRTRRPRDGRIHGDDSVRRDAQLHQARARFVLHVLVALRQAARPDGAARGAREARRVGARIGQRRREE